MFADRSSLATPISIKSVSSSPLHSLHWRRSTWPAPSVRTSKCMCALGWQQGTAQEGGKFTHFLSVMFLCSILLSGWRGPEKGNCRVSRGAPRAGWWCSSSQGGWGVCLLEGSTIANTPFCCFFVCISIYVLHVIIEWSLWPCYELVKHKHNLDHQQNQLVAVRALWCCGDWLSQGNPPLHSGTALAHSSTAFKNFLIAAAQ